MINIQKHMDFFDPTELEAQVHLIGCGAIGSHLAEQIARLGISNVHLWDFDTVSAHNIANQNFRDKDIGILKAHALEEIMKEINPEIEITIHDDGWKEGARLSGWVFLAVDNIDTRREIIQDNIDNPYIKGYCDIRMGLTDSQIYFIDKPQLINTLLGTMNFSHEEAKENVPVSACGLSLSVIPTIKVATAIAIANWINCLKETEFYNFIMTDAFNFILDKFTWRH